MQTETVQLQDLHGDPANARLHSTKNIEAIKSSLARFGQQKPIVIDADNIVRAGNGTLEAARDLGWPDIKVVRSDLIGPEMTAFAIADNRSAELAGWDYEVLGQVLGALKAEDANQPNELGWADHELENILAVDWTPPKPSQDLESFGTPGSSPEVNSSGDSVSLTFTNEETALIEEVCEVLSPDRELGKHAAIMQLVRVRLQG